MGRHSNLRCVFFDYGNVINAGQDRGLVERMVELSGVLPQEFTEAYFGSRPEYDRGVLDGVDYWRGFFESLGTSRDLNCLRELVELDVASWARIDEHVLDLASDLKRSGCPVGILSNMPIDQADVLRRGATWAREFDFLFLSAEFKLIKPELAMYEYVMRETAQSCESLCLIDDKSENIEGARRAGWHGIEFDVAKCSVEELNVELESWLAG